MVLRVCSLTINLFIRNMATVHGMGKRGMPVSVPGVEARSYVKKKISMLVFKYI